MLHRLPVAISAVVLLFVALLGSYLTFSLVMSDHHCPLMSEEMPLCVTTIDHLNHWQAAFSVIVVESLILFGLLFVAQLSFWQLLILVEESPPLSRTCATRPTLFEELFSQGLLNPRIP